MSDAKISELTDGTSPQATDEFAVARSGSTLKLLWSALKAAVYAPGGTDVAVADGGTGASTAANARTNLGVVPGTDVASQSAFSDHSARHENGGADEISVAGLSGLLADDQNPTSHHADHEDGGTDEISIAGLSGTSAALQTHLDDTSAAHAASAISIADTGGDFTATDVEGALAELQSDAETDAQGLADHLADSSAAHAASAISVADTDGNFTGTDVEAVLAELQDNIGAGGGSGAPTDATYITQTANGSLGAEQALSALASGIVKVTTGTGVLSTATANTDYAAATHASRHQDGGADEISIQGLAGTPTELTNHLNDTADAHDASAISVADSAGNFTGTDVEAVLAELQDNIDAGGGGGGSTTGEEETITLAQELFQ